MAKIQLKSDNINPFGGLFSIFKQFDRSGLYFIRPIRLNASSRAWRLNAEYTLRTSVQIAATRRRLLFAEDAVGAALAGGVDAVAVVDEGFS